MQTPREQAIGALVEEYGLHGAVHALVETCYRKAQLSSKTEAWRRVAQLLSAVETEAGALGL